MTQGSPISDVPAIDISRPEVVKNLKEDIDLTRALVLDSHLLKTYRACEMKFWWFEEYHIIGRGKSAAPAFGVVMHEGVEWFRRAKLEGKGFNEALVIGKGHLIQSYRKNMPDEMHQEVMQDDRRSISNAIRLLEGYCLHYEPMGLIIHYIEIPFALYLGQVNSFENYDINKPTKRDLVYVGIIDAVIEMHNKIYVNDLKTTAWTVSEQWLEGFRMDQGLLGYTVAARELLGVDTERALVHAMWVQKEPKSGKGKPLDEYFHTKDILWGQARMEEWHRNTILTAERIERSRTTGEWQMDWGQNCGAYGGCPYRPLCSAEPGFRKQLVGMDYERAVWSPLEDERMQKMEEWNS